MSNVLWQRLHKAQLVTGTQPLVASSANPLYLRLLAGFAGWVSVLFSLALIYSLSSLVLELFAAPSSSLEGSVSLVMAALYGGLALGLSLLAPGHLFLVHWSRACYLVSQGLLVLGLVLLLDNNQWAASVLLLVNAVLFWLFQAPVLRRLSCHLWLASICWLVWDSYLYLVWPVCLLVAALIWLNLFRWARWGCWLEPIAQSASLFFILGIGLFYYSYAAASSTDWGLIQISGENFWRWFNPANIACSVISAGAGLYLVRNMADSARFSALQAVIIGLVLLLSVANQWLVGVSGSVLLLALAVRIGYQRLALKLLLSLLVLLVWYYYSLHLSLLQKSWWLMGSGVCLIAAFILIRYLQTCSQTPQELNHD